MSRRFDADEALQAVFDFVDSQGGEEIALHYVLASNFPRRTFTRDADATGSLAQHGLTPQALLFVQPSED